MKSIVVFCGSSDGFSPDYLNIATETGKLLAEAGITVVYGGAKIGLMGAVADGALNAGGKVIGVLPDFMRSKEIAHDHLTEFISVETMHERKLKMHELSDGVIALPGGYGTMEELFEMLTWAQLGLHKKPMGILNHNGFYDPLLAQAEKMLEHGFIKPVYRSLIIDAPDPSELMKKMNNYTAPVLPPLISAGNT